MKFPSDPMHPLLKHEEWIERNLKKDSPLKDLPTIPEFFKGKEIFITGGSGFIGKVLIEKLLRSCPEIKTIYLLMRPKKGQNINERVKSITETILFDLLKRENPNFADKIVAISGDVSEINLGISESDKKLMENASIIFHSAASVRFDDPMKYAILMNTRGAREILKFAETLKNIEVFMHVSTTYCNVYLETVEEKVYPPIADWEKSIEICEKLDSDAIETVTKHYINFMPNTYVHSKNLAEHVCLAYENKIPIVIFRPSIVMCAVEEPFGGYVDNVNGPMGILLASCVGISKTMYCDPKNVMDVTPVDICVKGMIIAAWKRAHEPKQEVSVINSATASQTRMTIKQLLDIGIHGAVEEIPPGKSMVFLASGGVTLCKTWNLISCIFLQLIPAILVDFGLKLSGKRPKLMKIQRRIFEANKALSYFVTHNWTFKNDNFMNLDSFLRDEDLRAFGFHSKLMQDIIQFCRMALYGFRRYLLNENDEDLPKDRKYFKTLMFLTLCFKIMVYLGLFYLLFIKYDILQFVR